MVIVHDGHYHYGGDSQFAADITIHARVALSVITTQGLGGAHAFAGESYFCGKERTHFGSIGSGPSMTHHFVATLSSQGNGCSTRLRDVFRALGQKLQGGSEIPLRHVDQIVAALIGAWCQCRGSACAGRAGL
jgi:hypothetical protein